MSVLSASAVIGMTTAVAFVGAISLAQGTDITIYINGDIFTGNPDSAWADAVVVEDGRFAYVGNAEDAKLFAPGAAIVDLKSSTVIPGLYDSHAHPVGAGETMLYFCNIAGEAGVPELLQGIRDCAAKLPDGAWIQGGAWGPQIMSQTDMSAAEFLTAVDEAAGGRPVALRDFSNHNILGNNIAMRAAGLFDRDLSEFGDYVGRDADGNLTGFFVEDASSVFNSAIPERSSEELQQALSTAQDELHKQGFVGVWSADAAQRELDTFLALAEKGALNLHTGLSITWSNLEGDIETRGAALVEMVAPAEAYRNVNARFTKVLVDGIPPTRTAAFLAPYEGAEDGQAGDLLISPEELKQLTTWMDANGFTAQYHTVGDRAVRVTLDAIEAARDANGMSGLSHQLAHACIIDDVDIPRFGELGAVANFSPMFWAPSPIVDGMYALLGEDRVNPYCPNAALEQAGAWSTAGSDWPVVPDVNPWNGIEAFVTRQNPDGLRTDEYLSPDQKVPLEKALSYYTINGARALGLEDQGGSIEVGKYADMVVLNQDVFSVPEADINQTEAVMTIFEGNVVYRAKD